MDETLKIILEEYIKKIEDICNNLLKGLNDSENLCLKSKWDFFDYRAKHKKMEFEVNGISYRLHGKGCIAFNENMFIDWDFGHRSRWCGIDPWKVAMTLKKNKSNYIEYYDGNLIKEECEQAVSDSIMYKQYDQYYFKIPDDKTFKPDFPEEFDILIVEHFESKWSIPRNKVIDRFLRKSRWVYNQIDKNENKYILRFILKDKELYTIPYDDVGYPENAVKIMSDDILKNLTKS